MSIYLNGSRARSLHLNGRSMGSAWLDGQCVYRKERPPSAGVRLIATSHSTAAMAYSDDLGETWNEITAANIQSGLYINHITDGKTFVWKSNMLGYSDDGINWTVNNSAPASNFIGVSGRANNYLSVGHQSAILHSEDGVNWTQVFTNSNRKKNADYSPSMDRWVVGGGIDGYVFASGSGDINSWARYKYPGSGSYADSQCVLWSDRLNRWMIGFCQYGTGGCWSDDGETWTNFTLASGASWGNSGLRLFNNQHGTETVLARTSGAILKSADGKTWGQVMTTELGNSDDLLNSYEPYSGLYFSGTVNATSILIGTDGGTAWTQVDAPFNLRGLASMKIPSA